MPKSSIVTLIGRSNVGKSTLLNALVGSKVAITTPKPQTTRRPVQGIITRDEGQVVIVDTAGIMQKRADSLTRKLLHYVKDALKDINAILYVADPTRAFGDEEKQALKMIEHIDVPKLLVINKIDDRASEHFIDYYRDLANRFDNYVEVSAKTGKNTDLIVRWLFDHAPDGEFLYPAFQLTNLENKEWIAELVREKLYLRLRQEVPYSTHVEVDTVETLANGVAHVAATIYTNAERYKSMIIGKGGRGIKEIGQSTRNELEAVTGQKYFLELRVAVDERWIERLE